MTEKFEPQTHMFHSHRRPSMVILHGIAVSLEESKKILTGKTEYEASVPYLISAQGEIFHYVEETARAWHAGVSYWAGFTDINSLAIGIELEGNPVISDEKDFDKVYYQQKQMDNLAVLLKDICQRWNIQPYNILGHQDIAPYRKKDPGPHFDWAYLASQGIGLWHGLQPTKNDQIVNDKSVIENFKRNLTLFGYDPRSNEEDRKYASVIEAFQIHFLPWNICGQVTEQSVQALNILIQKKFSL